MKLKYNLPEIYLKKVVDTARVTGCLVIESKGNYANSFNWLSFVMVLFSKSCKLKLKICLKESTKANDELKKNVTSKTMAHKIKCQTLSSSYLN